MIARVLLPFGRFLLRALSTRSPRTTAIGRVLRAIALLPVFGPILVVLRIRLAIAGPLVLDGDLDGLRIRCRLPDLIQMYVWLFGVWEPDLAAFLRSRLRPGDVFVDVGANVGTMVLLASRAVGASGGVVAIEASPAVAADLRRTLDDNALTNVNLVTAAVSDAPGELTLFPGPRHNIGLTATVQHRGLQPAGKVRAAPLRDLVPAGELARARLVKIDVEGGEVAVLAGLVPDLARLPAATEFVIELSPTWWTDASLRPIDVLQPFLDAGFHVYLLPNSYWPWRYLWPNDVGRPRRLADRSLLERRMPRLDVVLSRIDAPEL